MSIDEIDPFTEEGLKEAKRRLERRALLDGDASRKRALENPDDEPTGKLTQPSEIDLYRDRKYEE